MLPWLAMPAAELLESGDVATGGRAKLHGGLACYGVYPTRDARWLTVAALEPKFWTNLCARLDRPWFVPWQTDPVRQPEMRANLEVLFASRTLAEWEAFFGDDDVCVAPVRTLDEALARWPDTIRQIVGSDGRPGRIVAGPLGETSSGPAPALGADTDAVLSELGVTGPERARLRAQHVI
jgi:crotonobetainyl-CoA:carnitine CoA-transferase CaiB-like acyl-CoA transferase